MNAQERNKAIGIGSVCVFSYMASYYMRNLLSVSTPAMLETGLFTKETIGVYSSAYFFVYAVGQLINGIIGDRVNPKKMVFFGLAGCGIASIIFGLINNTVLGVLIFALMGFALSMLRGPLVKAISENTLPKYAKVCCTFFSFAGLLGPFIAGFLAMLFDWRLTFVVGGSSCVFIAICAYIFFSAFEKKGVLKPTTTNKTGEKKNVWSVFRLEDFMFYMFIVALVEISGSSINFWMPTYLTDCLGFGKDVANMIFTAKTFLGAPLSFMVLFVLKLFKDNSIKVMKYAFFIAVVCYMGVWLVPNRYFNVAFYVVALFVISFPATLVWNIYIPNQAKSGMVSTVNGVLDSFGYAITAVANLIFSVSMETISWRGCIIMWIVIMLSGAVSAGIKNRTKQKELQ